MQSTKSYLRQALVQSWLLHSIYFDYNNLLNHVVCSLIFNVFNLAFLWIGLWWLVSSVRLSLQINEGELLRWPQSFGHCITPFPGLSVHWSIPWSAHWGQSASNATKLKAVRIVPTSFAGRNNGQRSLGGKLSFIQSRIQLWEQMHHSRQIVIKL